ncbi:hypothetical protein [Dactylosporangium sp. NPDC005555]|uniref:hypothetical protein n=1 Tax=Dactylosporangium sp. NPDC005555 TaxID=3154889 RepID=UPI0033B3C209
MSWDIFVLNVAATVTTTDEIPGDDPMTPLGTSADVLRRLRDGLPGVDLSDPAWGHLRGPGWTIELNIGAKDPVDSIMLHVRGGGDDVLGVIARVAALAGGRALDMSTGEFLTGDPARTEGWHGFQRYRDQVLGER